MRSWGSARHLARTGSRTSKHSHGRINELVFRVRDILHPTAPGSFPPRKDSEFRAAVAAILSELREELLLHFAREEGLFPFVRAHFLERNDAVDRIERAHDSICGAIVCLAHLAERRMHPVHRARKCSSASSSPTRSSTMKM